MDFEAIWKEAQAAAKAASDAQGERDGDGGSCGYAWAYVVPARGPFITWCRKMNDAAEPDTPECQRRNAYGSPFGWRPGWEIWGPGGYPGQSLDAKEAGAKAFVEVFKRHGIEMQWSSRVD